MRLRVRQGGREYILGARPGTGFGVDEAGGRCLLIPGATAADTDVFLPPGEVVFAASRGRHGLTILTARELSPGSA